MRSSVLTDAAWYPGSLARGGVGAPGDGDGHATAWLGSAVTTVRVPTLEPRDVPGAPPGQNLSERSARILVKLAALGGGAMRAHAWALSIAVVLSSCGPTSDDPSGDPDAAPPPPQLTDTGGDRIADRDEGAAAAIDTDRDGRPDY